MLKLIKYELRKVRTPLIVLLVITLALQGYFLYGLQGVEDPDNFHALVAAVGLMLCAYGAVITLLVFSVTSYSKELRDRSAYLIFMTPNSGVKIMASKLLFTTVLAIFFAAMYLGLGVLDLGLLANAFGELEEMVTELQALLLEYGIHVEQIVYGAVAVALYVLLSILSFASLTYVAVTLSNTLFRDRKWRGVVTLAIFFGLNWLLSKVSGMLPSALNELVVVENAGAAKISAYYGLQTTPTFEDILRAMLPSAGLSLAVVVASMLGCGWMLDKKVSL